MKKKKFNEKKILYKKRLFKKKLNLTYHKNMK